MENFPSERVGIDEKPPVLGPGWPKSNSGYLYQPTEFEGWNFQANQIQASICKTQSKTTFAQHPEGVWNRLLQPKDQKFTEKIQGVALASKYVVCWYVCGLQIVCNGEYFTQIS